MKCVICQNGSTKEGKVTHTLTQGGFVLLFKDVPAQVCENCKEPIFSSEVTKNLLRYGRKMKAQGLSNLICYYPESQGVIEEAPLKFVSR